MRNFKEPYYTGPDCVCCKKSDVENSLALAIQRREQMSNDESLDVVAAIDNAYQTGVNEERERIINLITEDWTEYPDVDWLIALIKGENK